eukprot:57374-Chlamydomonas_euryale.AAC.1
MDQELLKRGIQWHNSQVQIPCKLGDIEVHMDHGTLVLPSTKPTSPVAQGTRPRDLATSLARANQPSST